MNGQEAITALGKQIESEGEGVIEFRGNSAKIVPTLSKLAGHLKGMGAEGTRLRISKEALKTHDKTLAAFLDKVAENDGPQLRSLGTCLVSERTPQTPEEFQQRAAVDLTMLFADALQKTRRGKEQIK